MAKSNRQRKIDSLTEFKPRADLVALARINRNDLEPVYDVKGNITDTKRRSNVFLILRNADTITPNESAAGSRLVEIYATWKGLAGAPEGESAGYVQQGRAEPELVTDRMINAGREWSIIMKYVGPSSSRLLLALCQDIVEGDGSFIIGTIGNKPKVRWRHVVETVTGEKARDRQSAYVERACSDLVEYWR